VREGVDVDGGIGGRHRDREARTIRQKRARKSANRA
jgi:hypothetical protein